MDSQDLRTNFLTQFNDMTDLAHSSEEEPTFEDFRNENGSTYWWASDLSEMLGYKSFTSFKKVIDRATKAMMAIDVSHYENIFQEPNPRTQNADFKLSRFACYMVVMNSDSKKPEVAKAQVYFATMTRAFEVMMENTDQIERIAIRDDIKEGNKSLTKAANVAGVSDYGRFGNSGYLGLYNMNNWQLAKKRNIDKTKLFDHMGRAELAANYFRITMTEEKIKNQNIQGQANLERTHKEVGNEVRGMVKRNTGVAPEDLPQEQRLPEVKKSLKKANRELKKIDKKK